VNDFCLFWNNVYGFLEDIPYIFLDIPFQKMLPKIEIAYMLLCYRLDFLIKALTFLHTYIFLNYNSCYGKGKTNTLTKENYWKKHLSNHKNRIPRILCAPECFLHVTFSVNIFGFYCFCICCYYVLNKNRVKQILLV